MEIYRITKLFPRDEQYSLISQIRRTAIPIESNIAEGFSRKSCKESKQFYYIANSSLEEVKCQLIVSKDLKYINTNEFDKLFNLSEEVGKLLNSWIRSQK